MKNYLLLSGFALALGAGSAMAQEKTLSCPQVTTEQIEALFTDFNNAWATKDPATVAAQFTKNRVLLATVSNTPRDTPEEVEDYFVSFLNNSPVGTIDTSEIEIDCNTATRVGTWTVALTDAATGTKTDAKARYSFIYRYEDGSWKIDHLHSSLMPET